MAATHDGEKWLNTVGATFADRGRADAAISRLRAAHAAGDCLEVTLGEHEVLVTFDAGEQEDLAREIVVETGGQELDLPG